MAPTVLRCGKAGFELGVSRLGDFGFRVSDVHWGFRDWSLRSGSFVVMTWAQSSSRNASSTRKWPRPEGIILNPVWDSELLVLVSHIVPIELYYNVRYVHCSKMKAPTWLEGSAGLASKLWKCLN